MASPTNLAALYSVKSRFYRSVDVQQDILLPDALEGYVLTEQAAELARRIAEGVLVPGSTHRSWTITGPYGAGKSAFALFLTCLLADASHPNQQHALKLFRGTKSGSAHSAVLLNARQKAPKGFLVVLISGSRQAFLPALLEGMRKSTRNFFGNTTKANKIVEEIEQIAKKRKLFGTEDEVCDMLGRLAKYARAQRGAGLFIIVDEFGKFLEHAAANPTSGDIFVLQRIAEKAARSAGEPLGIATILHQSFDRYAAGLPEKNRDEWRKIQGRFQDAVFIEDSTQLLKLAGSSIVKRAAIPTPLTEYHNKLLDTAVALGALSSQQRSVFAGLFPLHPSVAAVLASVFRSALAQNERSLFSFLAARHDQGFLWFLERSETQPAKGASYRLDVLFDYLDASLGPALLANADGKRWGEISHALERIPRDAPPLAVKVLKTVGLLSLFGTQEMRASEEGLAFSLEDGKRPSPQLRETIQILEDASVLVFRKHLGAYGIWEGSDIDLEGRFREARERKNGGADLLAAIRSRIQLRPVAARRHFFSTGNIRYFETDVAGAAELTKLASQAPANGDGRIVYLLPTSGESSTDLLRAAKATTSAVGKDTWPLLIAIPQNVDRIFEAAADLEACNSVRRTTPELANDPVARRELAARTAAAETALDRHLGEALGWGDRDAQTAAVWVQAGGEVKGLTPRRLSEHLSTVMDDAFSSAPHIHNELLNRRVLSSSATAARRELAGRMVAKESNAKLEIIGFPPELSMYESVLARSKVHRKVGDSWTFAMPKDGEDPLRFRPAWQAVNEFLERSDGSRLPLTALREHLSQPPYGIKEGPFPILLLAVIIGQLGETALFEDGTFVPDLSDAVLERLLRNIESFEIARYRLDAGRKEFLRVFSDGLAIPEHAESPVEIARIIVKRIAQLSKHARTTRALPHETLLLREEVVKATDPLKLVFLDLPAALGHPSAELGLPHDAAVAAAAEYAQSFIKSLQNLENALPSLLLNIERKIASALDVEGTGEEFRTALARRAKRVAPIASELKLRVFLSRIMDATLPYQGWLESLAASVGNRPPAEWTDGEMGRFETGLAELRSLVFQAENVVVDQMEPLPVSGVAELARLTLESPGGKRRQRLLHINRQGSEETDEVERDLSELLGRRLGSQRESWLRVLGKVVYDILADAEVQSPPKASTHD